MDDFTRAAGAAGTAIVVLAGALRAWVQSRRDVELRRVQADADWQAAMLRRIADLEARGDAAQTRAFVLEQRAERAEAEVYDLREQLGAAHAELFELARELEERGRVLASSRDECDAYRGRCEALRRELAGLYADLGGRK